MSSPALARPSSSPHEQFVRAVNDRNPEEAVRLLKSGGVVFDARVGAANILDPSLAEIPLLFYAIIMESEEVMRALVRAGASVNKFVALVLFPGRPNEVNGDFNAAAISIIFEKPVELQILHRVSHVSFSPVYIPKMGTKPSSAFMMAVIHTNPLCLEYVIDHGKRGKAKDRSLLPFIIVNQGTYGSQTLSVFEVLHKKRAFDFKTLEKMDHMGNSVLGAAGRRQPGKRLTAADELLANARKSGDAGLMGFLVKKIGFVASAESMQAAAKCTDEFHSVVPSEVRENYDHRLRKSRDRAAGSAQDVHKYCCAECGATGQTFFCRCKERYCSAECQTKVGRTQGRVQEASKASCREEFDCWCWLERILIVNDYPLSLGITA